MPLRPYQEKGLAAVEQCVAQGVNDMLVQMATGTGKTPLFAMLKQRLKRPGRVLVLVHRDELATQALDKIRSWNPGVSAGIEKAEQRAGDAEYVVASVATIGRAGSPRLTQFDPAEFGYIITDECHHAVAQSYLTVYDHFGAGRRDDLVHLGVTATANRADGQEMGKVYRRVAYTYSILDGIREGYLSNLRGFQVKTHTDISHVHALADDFNRRELAAAINVDPRNHAIVKAWLDYGNNQSTVIFGEDIQHCKDLSALFKSYGLAFEAIWGVDPNRAAKLHMHRKGLIKGLINADLLTEGYDDWRIGCIILGRPFRSEGRYVQCVGRGTRIPEGIDNLITAREQGIPILKDECILIDMVDSSSKHSLVTLPSLHGFNTKLNMHGKLLTEIVEAAEELKQQAPLLNLTKAPAEDIEGLSLFAEQVNLFQVDYAPEVVQLSEYTWHRTGDYTYTLSLMGGDYLVLHYNILEQWIIQGQVGDYTLYDVRGSDFEEAINEADFKVRLYGGRMANRKAQRKAKWHDGPPDELQRRLCRRYGLTIPPGATAGDVHRKLNEILAKNTAEKLKQRGDQP